jgi:hypothetical protein
MYSGDNTGSLIYTFCTINNEWTIESFTGAFPCTSPNTSYLVCQIYNLKG